MKQDKRFAVSKPLKFFLIDRVESTLPSIEASRVRRGSHDEGVKDKSTLLGRRVGTAGTTVGTETGTVGTEPNKRNKPTIIRCPTQTKPTPAGLVRSEPALGMLCGAHSGAWGQGRGMNDPPSPPFRSRSVG
jgi:hypothetical protein